jgi:hypothetical protein
MYGEPYYGRSEMKLIPIEYRIDDYELPDHLFVSGILYIEIDETDELPYVWGFDLTARNETTGRTGDYHFYANAKHKDPNCLEIQKFFHKDKKLMDDIFDDCAREGMWS